jgi:hypothetical protein
MKHRRSCPPIHQGSVAFAGFRFPPEVILLAVPLVSAVRPVIPRPRPERAGHRRVRLKKRDTAAATKFFTTAITAHGEPVEVTTDRSPVLAKTIRELAPGAHHDTRYANNRVEADHGRLKARLRPMRGLQTDRTATV